MGIEGERRAQAIVQSDVLAQEFGDDFLAGGNVPVQALPSEANYLLDPNHSEFPGMKWSPPEVFHFDPRLLDSALR